MQQALTKRQKEKFTLVLNDYELGIIEDALEFYKRNLGKDVLGLVYRDKNVNEAVIEGITIKLYSNAYK